MCVDCSLILVYDCVGIMNAIGDQHGGDIG